MSEQAKTVSFRPACITKICGCQDKEAVLTAAEAGATMIGMIFVPKSKRCISTEEGKIIVKALQDNAIVAKIEDIHHEHKLIDATDPIQWFQYHAKCIQIRAQQLGRPLSVGVFMNQTVEEVNNIANAVDLDYIQLHGSEDATFASQLHKPTIKVMHVWPGRTAENILSSLEAGPWEAVVIDAQIKDQSGGLGLCFDWKIAKEVLMNVPVLFAGGLTPDNIREAISCSSTIISSKDEKENKNNSNGNDDDDEYWYAGKVWGVDVSSGTETNGVKDHDKIRAFVKCASSSI